ncbi:MAG TPA: transcription elongation factor GreA [Candidatus Angelobacter sp.]|nr:transcription elongation factor GreA [Candidatus Angelobacter sp.]
MNKLYQITNTGKKELELKLEELKSHRASVASKIAEARDFGDLSENAEYEVAREEQGLVETRIATIEDILLNAEIIKKSGKSKISLGSKVELKTGKTHIVYTIVGPVEADPLDGKISNKSPIGEALFGKKIGDKAVIITPKGDITYEIVNIG